MGRNESANLDAVAGQANNKSRERDPEAPPSDPPSAASNSSDAGSLGPLQGHKKRGDVPPGKYQEWTLPTLLKSGLRNLRPTSKRDLDDLTHKYVVSDIIDSIDSVAPGYGKVAAFEACDPNFLIYRRFAWLHNRVLLHTQDELQELEGRLKALDDWEFKNGDPGKLVQRRQDDEKPDSLRTQTLLQIKAKLAEYDEILFRLRKLTEIERPTKRNQNSVYNLINTSQSIASGEAKWIRQWDDLVALAHNAEHGWFNGFLEDSLRMLCSKITLAIFRTKEQKIKTGSYPGLTLLSPKRIDVFLRIVLTILAVVLLLIPVLILVELQTNDPSAARHQSRWQVLTIFVSTLIFSASCSVVTKAKRQEVFVATATYCAVLVVFLGNSTNVPVQGH